jgi:hypothetical protein
MQGSEELSLPWQASRTLHYKLPLIQRRDPGSRVKVKTVMVSIVTPLHTRSDLIQVGVVHRDGSSSDLESPIKIRSFNFLSRDRSSHAPSDQGRIALEIEWFTEAEIEAQLSTLLVSYRAFYLHHEDSTDVTTYGEADSARIARQTLKAIFEDQLGAAEDEGLLLGEEEEDVMNLFMTYIKEMEIPTTAQTEIFPSVQSCLDRVAQLGTIPNSSRMDASWKFVRKIT